MSPQSNKAQTDKAQIGPGFARVPRAYVFCTQDLVVTPALQAMVASLILGRTISREELLARLLRRMRQHSIGRLSRREYVLHFLNQHPP